VRYGALRDHGFAAMVGHYPGDGRDYYSKGDKYPANGVNLRRVFWIAGFVQVRHCDLHLYKRTIVKARMPSAMKSKAGVKR